MKSLGGVLLLVLLACCRIAAAQGSSEPSLNLQVTAESVRLDWKVSLYDLDAPLGLDANHDGRVTWTEIEHRRADIESYLSAHLHVSADGSALELHSTKLMFGDQGGIPFLLAQLSAINGGAVPHSVGVEYALMSKRAANRCLLTVIWPEGRTQKREITAAAGTVSTFEASAARSVFTQSLVQGIWHIWTGYDHILFLIVLLIPAVFQSTATGREAVPDFRQALLRVVIIVSAFTLAHSLTLTCAALQWIHLPSRLVESVIAASIVVAAANNFLPRTAGGRSAWLACGFGLIHGFGFAGALSEIGADSAQAWWQIILAFNLGVEVGQLAIVSVFLPIAYALRETRFYRTGVLYGGSSIAGVCALVWLWQRALGGSA
jgi:hypothetical protein